MMASRKKSTSALISLLVSATLSGCDGPGATWSGTVIDSAGVRLVQNPVEPSRTAFWRVLPALQISEATSGAHAVFGSVQDVSIDSESRVVVLDGASVKWFDPQGRFLFSAGGIGEGPGEFTNAGAFQVVVGVSDSVLVPDGNGRRAAIFGPDGRFSRQFSIPSSDLWPRQWKRRTETSLVARRLDGFDDRLIELTWAGDTLPGTRFPLDYPQQFPTATNPNTLMLAAAPVWSPLPSGGWAVGHSHQYRVQLVDSTGRPRVAFSKEARPNELTERQKSEYLDRLRAVITRAMGETAWSVVSGTIEGPYHAPLITDIAQGPDRTIWVERALPFDKLRPEAGNLYRSDGHGSSEWDVFSEEGVFLFPLSLPAGFDLRRISGTTLVGIHSDELGVQTVQLLRLDSLSDQQ